MSDILKDITPLPWYVTDIGDYPLLRERASDLVLAQIEDGGHVDQDISLEHRAIIANARYIVHAANNYPALVEALKAIAGNNWKDQTRARHFARTALTELGEA